MGYTEVLDEQHFINKDKQNFLLRQTFKMAKKESRMKILHELNVLQIILELPFRHFQLLWSHAISFSEVCSNLIEPPKLRDHRMP